MVSFLTQIECFLNTMVGSEAKEVFLIFGDFCIVTLTRLTGAQLSNA